MNPNSEVAQAPDAAPKTNSFEDTGRLPTPEEISATPTVALPELIRSLGDRFATAEQERLFAYFSYRERRTSLMLFYHRDEHLMITAAAGKADIDPEVSSASRNSLKLKARAEAIARAEQHAINELKVRLKCSAGGTDDSDA